MIVIERRGDEIWINGALCLGTITARTDAYGDRDQFDARAADDSAYYTETYRTEAEALMYLLTDAKQIVFKESEHAP